MNLIASSVPGRIRLRHASLRNHEHLETLRGVAAQWHGVSRSEINPRVGSLLLFYDENRLAQALMESRLTEALRELKPTTVGPVNQAPAAPRRSKGTPRVRANRVAKRGMLVAMAASLAAAAARHKGLHILTGNAFLAFLAIHMYVYRRHLLR